MQPLRALCLIVLAALLVVCHVAPAYAQGGGHWRCVRPKCKKGHHRKLRGMRGHKAGMRKKRGMRGPQSWSLRIDTGSTVGSYDTKGQFWAKDQYLWGDGTLSAKDVTVKGARFGQGFLYTSETYGATFGYLLPVPKPGAYIVDVRVAELYFTTPGVRVFDIMIQGTTQVRNLDLVKEVGPFRAVSKVFTVYTSTLHINVTFIGRSNNGQVCAIAVIPGNRMVIPPPPPSPPPSPPSPPPSPPPPPPPPSPPPAILYPVTYANDFKVQYCPQNVKPYNAPLGFTLTLNHDCGAAVVSSKKRYRQGSFAASMKSVGIDTMGVVVTLYMTTKPQEDRSRLDEIDYEFKKGGRFTQLQSNFYQNGQGSNEQNFDNLWFKPWKRFHRYRINWGPNYLEWKIDGKLMRRYEKNATNLFPTQPMYMIFSIWHAEDWNGPTFWNASSSFTMTVHSMAIHATETFPAD